LAGTAGPLHSAAWQQTPQPAAGISVAAMVLGICAIVPGAGVLAGPLGIILGIVALSKKRRGRGFAITGIAAGAGGLLTVQALTALYIYMMAMVFSTFPAMMKRAAMTIPPPTATMPAGISPVFAGAPIPGTQGMDDDDLRDAIEGHGDSVMDAAAATAALIEARSLYASRHAKAGNLFLCVRAYWKHRRANGNGELPSPDDVAKCDSAESELIEKIKATSFLAEMHVQNRWWAQAAEKYAELVQMVPEKDNRIQVNAVEAQAVCLTKAATNPGAPAAPLPRYGGTRASRTVTPPAPPRAPRIQDVPPPARSPGAERE
jgi:hypothetical protein